MAFFFKKITSVFISGIFMLGLANSGYAAETACNNNGGSGWAINDGGITNLLIPFNFGDVSKIFDLDVSTDITHTYIGDLTVKVSSPESGTQITLFERPGTAASDTAPIDSGPYGCSQNNIVATFDDEAATATDIETVCPVANGASYYPRDSNLSVYDGEDPSGNWGFYLSDSANADTGRLNAACITASFAAVTFDKWVSSDATCVDNIDSIAIAPGTDVYFCYTVNNPSTEAFTINGGGTTDSQGHDLSALEGVTYNPKGSAGDSKTIAIGPVVAGSAGLPIGTTINNASVTGTFATANFTGTLTTPETATAIVANPIINTSTKTVVDVNGGSTEAGDVLQYTISIIETAGIYTPNVQLTDIVDANLNSITFTTLPAGAINNTVGNNIDISGITLPANGTVTIVYTVNIGALVTVGTNIDNTATISHAGSGITFNAVAGTIVVSNAVPASGVKQLYFDAINTASPNLTRDPANALINSQTGTLNNNTTFTLDQGIVFQSPFTFTSGNDVVVQVLARRRSAGGQRTINARLVSANGVNIGTGSNSWNAWGWQTVLINIPAGVTLPAGDAIRLELTNTGGNIQLRTINGANKAQLQIQTSTVINVDSIGIYAAPYPSTLKFSSYDPGSTVYIRSAVSDPFGSADITSANLTITDSATATPVNNLPMTLIPAATTALSKTFEYAYDMTSAPAPVGFWNISVRANEGFETSVTHTSNVVMIVGLPDLTISKSSEVKYDPINVSNFKALPGAILEYTINVDNTGYGYVDNDKFVITDPVPSGTTLFFGQNPSLPFVLNPVDFVDGVDTSGLTFTLNTGDLGDPLDDVEFYNTGGTNLVTPTYDANGYDTTSPPIDLIRINPKGELRGSNGTTNPSLQLKFRVRVE